MKTQRGFPRRDGDAEASVFEDNEQVSF